MTARPAGACPPVIERVVPGGVARVTGFLIHSSGVDRPNHTLRSDSLSTSPRSLRAGQSLVGLLVVLLVLTLLTALAASRMDLTRYRSDAMARQAATLLGTAARRALHSRHDVVVRIDSSARRLGTLDDRNGNRRRDEGEREVWVALDPVVVIQDPPALLPTLSDNGPRGTPTIGAVAPVARRAVAFRPKGGASTDFVLYLTSDASEPRAWRAVHVVAASGAIQLWRFDGTRWTRGRT